ncbi:MAG: SPFH domain-containing protein [Planctomycetota bacterium]|jgi:regulator of protease activity HflC (stomatin/prohibitin superfamily)
MKSRIINCCLLVVLVAVLVAGSGCGKVVPPGTTVILLKPSGKVVIKHEGVYKAWGRTKVYFVDTKLKSYAKELKILCADDINMDVSVKWVGAFMVSDVTIDTIKKKVPAQKTRRGDISGFELSLDAFFKTTMADILSSIARSVISPYKTDNIREKREEIRERIKQGFLLRMKELKYPVETADVLVTNLDYPPEITAKRKRIKDAELQDVENAALAKAAVAKAKRDAELAAERGKAQLVEAEADAAANKVRAASLTPEILAVKQLETLVKLAEGPNNTVVVIPFDAIKPGGLQETLLNREAIERLIDLTKKSNQ